MEAKDEDEEDDEEEETNMLEEGEEEEEAAPAACAPACACELFCTGNAPALLSVHPRPQARE